MLWTLIPTLGTEEVSASSTFSDVNDNYWASDEIDYIAEQGIANGDGVRFRPEEPVNRAAASVMMTKSLGYGGHDRSAPTYSDVSKDFWAYKYIERASELGIFQGTDGAFKPNDSIRKAQVAAVVARAFFGDELEEVSYDGSFTDISDRFWAKDYIEVLVENHIIEEGGSFRPNDEATRAELSAYLARAMNKELRLDREEEKPSNTEILYEGVVVNIDDDDELYVRSGPGTDYRHFDKLDNGERVDVYGEEGKWLEIFVRGKKGYVSSYYVEKVDEVQSGEDSMDYRTEPIAEALVSVSSTLNVRSGPGTNYETIGKLKNGDVVEIYERTNESWALIKFNNQWAYTHRNYLREKKKGSNGLAGKTIVIDPGHGDHDPGAQANGLIEKNVVLEVGLRVEKLLEDAGVNVVMTRKDDTFITLQGRVDIAERAYADSFVSIHANAASAAAEGAETFYNSDHVAEESKKLAQAIQTRLVQETGMKHRRVADARFYVIRNTTMPSTLVELGFLTNPGDVNRMKQAGYPDRAAQAIYNGIRDFYDW